MLSAGCLVRSTQLYLQVLMGWQNTALVLHSSKEERKMLCPKPDCAISVGSEQREELVHGVGTAVGFGSEGRRRT